MKRKLTGSATSSMVLFFASSVLASVLGLRQVDRLNTEPGWVADIDIPAGQFITPAFLRKERIKTDGAVVTDPRELIGKQLRVNKKSGDAFSANDVSTPKTRTLAQAVPAGRVLYTLKSDPYSIPVDQLRGGDRLDVLVRNRNGVHKVASDVRLIGVMRSGGAKQSAKGGAISLLANKKSASAGGLSINSLVVAVKPHEVYHLATIGNSDRVSLVLHGATDIARGGPLQVAPRPTHREVEMVNGLSRSKVQLRL